MKKISISLLILLLINNGCTHSILQYSNEKDDEFYARVEKLCEKRNDLLIETIDDTIHNAGELKVNKDTISFIENNTNQIIIKKTYEIKSISFTQTSRGIFDGLIYGTLIGSGVGLLGQLNPKGGAAPKGDIYFLLYSALTGAAIGITYGLINPGKIIIKFY
jgi:hypothetical protein